MDGRRRPARPPIPLLDMVYQKRKISGYFSGYFVGKKTAFVGVNSLT
jgi:hypothetical protein